MLWVADQEDAAHRVEGSAGQLRKRVDSGCRALGVTLENEASVRVGREDRIDVVDDLWLSE